MNMLIWLIEVSMQRVATRVIRDDTDDSTGSSGGSGSDESEDSDEGDAAVRLPQVAVDATPRRVRSQSTAKSRDVGSSPQMDRKDQTDWIMRRHVRCKVRRLPYRIYCSEIQRVTHIRVNRVRC
jgi:hypothetical protein